MRTHHTESKFWQDFPCVNRLLKTFFFLSFVLEISNFPFVFLRKGKKKNQEFSPHSFFSSRAKAKVFIASADFFFFLPLIPMSFLGLHHPIIGLHYLKLESLVLWNLRGLLLHLYFGYSKKKFKKLNFWEDEESIKKTFLSLETFRNKTLQSYFHHEMD